MLTYDELKKLNDAFKNNDNKKIMDVLHSIESKRYDQGFNDGYDTCKEDIKEQNERDNL